MSAIGNEYDDKEQAYAICMDSWNDKDKAEKALINHGFDPEIVKSMSCADRHIELAILARSETCEGCGEPASFYKSGFLCESCYAKNKLRDAPDSFTKSMTLNFEVGKIIKAKDDPRFLVRGYASPELRDKEGRIIPDLKGDAMDLPSLWEAFLKMIKRVERWNFIGDHSNAQIGALVPFDKIEDENGLIWETKMVEEPDEQYPMKGLHVIAEVFGDMKKSKAYQEAMLNGDKLMISIGGDIKEVRRDCGDGICKNIVVVEDLYDISACSQGVNQGAYSTVIKSLHGITEETQESTGNSYNQKHHNNDRAIMPETIEAMQKALEFQSKVTLALMGDEEAFKLLKAIDELSDEQKTMVEAVEKHLASLEKKLPEETEEEKKKREEAERLKKEEEEKKKREEEKKKATKKGVPNREDFDDDLAYAKAVVAFHDEEEQKELQKVDDRIEKAIKALRDELKVPTAEEIKKSLMDSKIEGTEISFGEAFKKGFVPTETHLEEPTDPETAYKEVANMGSVDDLLAEMN